MTETMKVRRFGDLLSGLLALRSMQQTELARAVGVDKAQLNRMIKQCRALRNRELVEKIGRVIESECPGATNLLLAAAGFCSNREESYLLECWDNSRRDNPELSLSVLGHKESPRDLALSVLAKWNSDSSMCASQQRDDRQLLHQIQRMPEELFAGDIGACDEHLSRLKCDLKTLDANPMEKKRLRVLLLREASRLQVEQFQATENAPAERSAEKALALSGQLRKSQREWLDSTATFASLVCMRMRAARRKPAELEWVAREMDDPRLVSVHKRAVLPSV